MEELRYAEYILKIAEEKNISRAAEKLFITQPALSRILHQVEKSIGFEIFDRSVHPLKLTACGTLYINYLNTVKELEKGVKSQISLLSNEAPKILRIGIVPERGIEIYSEIFPRLIREEQTIKFMIQSGFSKDLEALFANGKLDICILNSPLQNKAQNQIILDREEIFLVAGKKNALPFSDFISQQNPEGAADLGKLKTTGIVVLNKGQRMREVAEDILQKHHIQDPTVIEVFNLSTAMQLVATSSYVSFIPESTLTKSSLKDDIRCFHLGPEKYTWDLRLLYKDDRLKEIANAISTHYAEQHSGSVPRL